MFEEGQIIFFQLFPFKNGANPAPKFFLVLRNIHGKTVIASLPTSQNYIPNFLVAAHGCINDDDSRVNCYLFERQRVVCDNGFSFNLHTYIHGNDIDDYEIETLKNNYARFGAQIVGKLLPTEYNALIECVTKSGSVKHRVKRFLTQ